MIKIDFIGKSSLVLHHVWTEEIPCMAHIHIHISQFNVVKIALIIIDKRDIKKCEYITQIFDNVLDQLISSIGYLDSNVVYELSCIFNNIWVGNQYHTKGEEGFTFTANMIQETVNEKLLLSNN